MLNRFSIRTKMLGAFGAVIALVLAVGAVVMMQKSTIMSEAQRLADESVPMVNRANSVERYALKSSEALFQYTKSRDSSYYDEAIKYLGKVEENLAGIATLAAEQSMDELASQVKLSQNNTSEYRALAEEVSTINARMDEIQAVMDTAAGQFMRVSNELLEFERETLHDRIKNDADEAELTRVENLVQYSEDIRRDGYEARITNFRSQLQQNPEGLLTAEPIFIEIEEYLDKMLSLTQSAEVKVKVEAVREAGGQYWSAMQDMHAEWTRRDQVVEGLAAAASTVMAEAQSATERGIEQTDAAASATVSRLSFAMTIVGVGLAVASALGVAIALFMTNAIVRPIARVVERVQTLADRNLAVDSLKTNSRDETGKLTNAVNSLHDSLREIVSSVKQSASEVSDASDQIASSTQEISSGMDRQSQQVSQVSAAIEEMSASVREVATKSGEAAGEAKTSGHSAEEGGKVVEETIEGMTAINAAVAAGSQSVAELGKRGEQIGEIIEVINDIADQTNLLALNAAIEAARAGEHGRGFAVVADEVRKLADRTTKATEEISNSITAIQSETSQAVDRMNAGTEHVNSGVVKANESGERLRAIVDTSKLVAAKVESIAAAAEQQSSASEEVAQSVEQISQVSREAADSARSGASAADQLSSKASELTSLVGQFRI